MPKRLARGNRTIWAAAMLCLAAGSFLSWQLGRSDVPPPRPAAPSAEDTPASPEAKAAGGDESFDLADADDYADVIERPLFSRTRRPPPADEAAGAAAGAAGGGADEVAAANLSLAGVLLTRGRKVALLRIDNDPKVMHVSEGQQAGGWLIETIRPDRIIVRRGDNSGEVVLDFRRQPEGAPRAGAPVARQPARPPAGAMHGEDVQDEEDIAE